MAKDLALANVVVNFDEKPRCEIVCPLESCDHVSKLSLIKQKNIFAPPKFNPHNFQRHFDSQHVNKKRKYDSSSSSRLSETLLIKKTATNTLFSTMFCDISPNKHENAGSFKTFLASSSSTPIHQKSSNAQTQLFTPKTATINMLREKLSEANNKIKEREIIQPTPIESSSLSLLQTPKSVRIDELHAENIMIRHKYMDASKKLRTFCRVKPDLAGDCFDWQRNKDGTGLQICMMNALKQFSRF